MRILLYSGLLAALLPTETVAAEPAPTLMEPSGPWKIEYAESACTLSRPFSAAAQDYLLAVTFEPIERLAWLRIGSSDKVRRRDDGKAIVEVDGVKLDQSIHFNLFANESGGAVREFMFDEFQKQVGGALRTLRLHPEKHGDLMFNMADFPKAMAAANACVTDLHRSLGVAPGLVDEIVVKPDGSALQFADFPETPSGFDLTLFYWVTREGKVDECRVLAPSGLHRFDETICDQLKKKARFRPARNAAGATIRAPVYDHIRLITEIYTTSSPGR